MPRKHLKRHDTLPYHVTARTNGRVDFPLAPDRTWEIFAEECLFVHLIYGVEFQAAVLMPNHFHILLTVPQHDLGFVMNVFMKLVSRRVNQELGRTGHLFGGAHFRTLITNTRYYRHVLKYVYRNPVKAGLCSRVEDYPFSTLHGLTGQSPLLFPLFFTRTAMELCLPDPEPGSQLPWLNRPFPAKAEVLIRKGLRRSEFLTLIDRRTQRPVELLEQML